MREIEQRQEYKTLENAVYDTAISDEEWEKAVEAFNAYTEKSGYDELNDKIKKATERLNEVNKAYDDAYATDAEEKEREAIEKSGLAENEYFQKAALKEYGTTPNWREAGYMLDDGRLLNFTGEKGKHYGHRGADHRNISIIFENTSGSEAMLRFMKYGNIRVMAETPGIDISIDNEPTDKQYAKIKDMARRFADEEYFNVDLTNSDGYTVGALEYEGRINAERIVNDIKHYFETGEIREQSDVDKFRYSRVLGADAVSYDALVKKPDMKITTVTGPVSTDRADIIDEAIKNILAVGKESKIGVGAVHVDDVDRDVVVSKNSISHGLDRRTPIMGVILPKIGEILKNSIAVNELIPKLNTANGTYILIGAAQENNGDTHIVRFVVNSFTDGLEDVDVLYAINTKKEPAAFLPRSAASATPPTGPTISISNLLDNVKDNFPDVLSMDVLKHFGITQRPAGELGQAAKYSRVLNSNAVEYVERLKSGSRQRWEMIDVLEDLAERRKGKSVSKEEMKRIARAYAHGNENKANIESFAGRLKNAAEMLKNGTNVDTVLYGLYKIAKDELTNIGTWELRKEVAEFRKEFRNGKNARTIYIAPDIMKTVAEKYGGREQLRKRWW